MQPPDQRLSKRMSYVLRHNPADLGLELDSNGWVDLELFASRLFDAVDEDWTVADVLRTIENNDKKRFELVDGQIRAAQGHSVDVDLGLAPTKPPPFLWHGTGGRFLPSIFEQGLLPQNRRHVHLSESRNVATDVGSRRGSPVILQILSGDMANADHNFFKSANGVWLTAAVPPGFIEL